MVSVHIYIYVFLWLILWFANVAFSYTCSCRIHTDAMNNRRVKKSLTKYVPLTLLQGFEKVIQGLRVRGSWGPNITAIFWPPLLWPPTLCLSRSHDAQPGALGSTLLGTGFLYCILSASSLDPNSPGPQGLKAWCGFLYHISTPTGTRTQHNWLLSWLSYIIVQRPLDRPLDLWNGTFNRHQAEITVMQFRGHSLPVRQSMRVSWDFLARPISSAKFRPRDFLS